MAASQSGNIEHQARQLRYAALAELARHVDARWIVTAHHGDDQLETLLMRMIRGTGVRGLQGIAWQRDLEDRQVIRPMLGVTRDEGLQLLTHLGQTWREDQTNRDVDRVRARLRGEVTPVLRDIRPDSASQAVALSDEARQLNALVDGLASQAKATATQPDDARFNRTIFARSTMQGLALPVLGRVLQDTLVKHGVGADTIGREPLHALMRAIADGQGGRREFHFANHGRVWVTRDHVEFLTDA